MTIVCKAVKKICRANVPVNLASMLKICAHVCAFKLIKPCLFLRMYIFSQGRGQSKIFLSGFATLLPNNLKQQKMCSEAPQITKTLRFSCVAFSARNIRKFANIVRFRLSMHRLNLAIKAKAFENRLSCGYIRLSRPEMGLPARLWLKKAISHVVEINCAAATHVLLCRS